MSYKNNFRLRAGCVCYRNDASNSILLVQSLKTPETWCLPGGGIESGESALLSAKRELFEEAGILANISECIGVFKNGSRVTLMFEATMTDCLQEWPEKKDRKRGWFEAQDVYPLLKSNYQRFMLKSLSEVSEGMPSNSHGDLPRVRFTPTQNRKCHISGNSLASSVADSNANMLEPDLDTCSKDPDGNVSTNSLGNYQLLFPEHHSGQLPLFDFKASPELGRHVGYLEICGLNLANICQHIDQVIANVETNGLSLSSPTFTAQFSTNSRCS